ncbi:MAG: cupredoxin domain-containing protein [Bacteroidota bacterium]|nr:cupredoxin domain-containing protein [Bacteroidota bacterium]
MELNQIFVTLAGLAVIVWIAWFFWFSEKQSLKVQTAESGIQEVVIKVKGGYSPDVITVEKGRPVRLDFYREETAVCSEQVLFPDFNKQATLTPFKTIPLEFTPDKAGEFGFQCGMGMLHGKIIVE